MKITVVEDNYLIPASALIKATLRSDLVPVPLSLELEVLDQDKMNSRLKLGGLLRVNDVSVDFRIVKIQPLKLSTIKEGKRLGGLAGVAIPNGCERLITPADKAIILSDTSFGHAMRGCGAKLRSGVDLPLPEFVCLKGTIPTTRIARYAQQEAAVIAWKDGRLSAIKIDDLLKQEPILQLDPSDVAWINSDKLEGMAKASYVSVDVDGSTILGSDTKQGIGTRQAARLDTRQINNMHKVLIQRGTIVRAQDFMLNAGSTVQVNDKKYLILTAAHLSQTGALGDSSRYVTKLWLGSL